MGIKRVGLRKNVRKMYLTQDSSKVVPSGKKNKVDRLTPLLVFLSV